MDTPSEEEVNKHCSEVVTKYENFIPEMRLDELCSSLRFLRKACMFSGMHQNLIANHGNFLTCIAKLMEKLMHSASSEEYNKSVRLCIQLLGNITVNNEETKKIIWGTCSGILSVTLQSVDEKIANYSAMVVYNILLGNGEDICDEFNDVVVAGLVSSASHGSEFGQFAVELLMSRCGWLEKYYPKLASQQKYYVLDLMENNLSSLSDLPTEGSIKCHLSAIQFICGEFRSRSEHILDTRNVRGRGTQGVVETSHQEKSVQVDDPCEISKILEVLASASSKEAYLSALQLDGPLLVQTAFLLRSIHAVGKLAEGEGDLEHPFAPLQKLSNFDSRVEGDYIEVHPAYGFKKNLVRLIGNLAWKNMDVQNKILELECVPLVLECCNIDERNPFITQWAIMAIRNLCDGNLEVQKVIAGLKREGVISCDLLNEMGLTLHDPGDPSEKISIVQLPR